MSKMCHLSQVSQAIAWDMPNNFYSNVYAQKLLFIINNNSNSL